MIVFFNPGNGLPVDVYHDNEQHLIPVSHPYLMLEIDEKENRQIMFAIRRSIASEDERFKLVGGKLQKDGVDVVLSVNADKAQFKNEFTQTNQTLTNIINEESPTNAWVVESIKTIARTQRLLLRLFYRMYSQ